MIVAPLGNIAIASIRLPSLPRAFAICRVTVLVMQHPPLWGRRMVPGVWISAKNFAYMTVGLGMGVMALMGMVMYVFAPEMIGVLSPVESIRELGTTCLRIEAFAEPFFAASIVTYSVCVGAGDTMKPAAINLGTMWLVKAYPCLRAFEKLWTGGCLDSGMATELTFRGILFLIRLFRGAWMKSFQC